MSVETTNLPCGCVMTVGGDLFSYTPCSLDCYYYKFVVEEAERQGKAIVTLDLRER